MLKRLLDLLVAASALILLAPLLLVVAALVRLDSPGPVLFSQERVGHRRKLFRILKFRTMKHSERPNGAQITVAGDARITSLGAKLRKWKLDELPQLVNVLRGEMSLVGPRPEVPRYAALYSEEQREVLEARPGITDPASLEFRDENELLAGREDAEAYYLEQVMPRKLELNRRYLEQQSLLLDLRIILATVARVLLPMRGPRSWASDRNQVGGASQLR
jgi:lipopolysaccharide/colanic/teichoic acid biosynthesis glycosyltransferase